MAEDTNDELIIRVKKLRIVLNQSITFLQTGYYGKGREVSLAITELQSVRHWLGEHLSVLGVEYPYPNGINPENTIVDPPADV